MKSIAQIWFGRVGATSGCGAMDGSRRFPRRGRLSRIRQYTRQHRL